MPLSSRLMAWEKESKMGMKEMTNVMLSRF